MSATNPRPDGNGGWLCEVGTAWLENRTNRPCDRSRVCNLLSLGYAAEVAKCDRAMALEEAHRASRRSAP